jgi:hypothetical protein
MIQGPGDGAAPASERRDLGLDNPPAADRIPRSARSAELERAGDHHSPITHPRHFFSMSSTTSKP